MSSRQKQPVAYMHTNLDRLAGKQELYSDLYRAGVRRAVPQMVIELLPETIPLEVDDVEALSKESPLLRNLLEDGTPPVLEVTLNQKGTDRLHKALRSRRLLPRRAMNASVAMFLAAIFLPFAVLEQAWGLAVLGAAVIVGGFVVRRMSINHSIAGVDAGDEFYPAEGLNGVSHPAFEDIMVKLAELAELQNIPVLDHPFLGDLQSVAIFVRDTEVDCVSDQERIALAEEAAHLIDIIGTKINEEIAVIIEVRKSTQHELDALGANAAQEFLDAGDRLINDIKVAGIRDRADILRKQIE